MRVSCPPISRMQSVSGSKKHGGLRVGNGFNLPLVELQRRLDQRLSVTSRAGAYIRAPTGIRFCSSDSPSSTVSIGLARLGA